MKYEHQINWANVCSNKLDISTVRSALELSVVPYFTSSSLLSQLCPNLICCTLYDRKNRINSYDFLRITRVHALLFSISFKPIFVVDSTLVINMLSLLQFSMPSPRRYIFTRSNTLNFFRVFGLTEIPLFIFCPLSL